jgi:hypothetical protein
MENNKKITSNIIAMLSSIGALFIGCGATCGAVCTVPLLSFIGVSGATLSKFSWLDKFQPYLIGLTILSLGYGFYQAYRPVKNKIVKNVGCECPPTKRNFFTSKSFLWIATLFCLFLWTYPLFSITNKSACDPKGCKRTNISLDTSSIQQDSSKACGKVCNRPCE